jgi:1-acyl-sn-glycerol-3-phosphate acyltransferase
MSRKSKNKRPALGNDPFQRGAAAPAPSPEPAPAAEAVVAAPAPPAVEAVKVEAVKVEAVKVEAVKAEPVKVEPEPKKARPPSRASKAAEARPASRSTRASEARKPTREVAKVEDPDATWSGGAPRPPAAPEPEPLKAEHDAWNRPESEPEPTIDFVPDRTQDFEPATAASADAMARMVEAAAVAAVASPVPGEGEAVREDSDAAAERDAAVEPEPEHDDEGSRDEPPSRALDVGPSSPDVRVGEVVPEGQDLPMRQADEPPAGSWLGQQAQKGVARALQVIAQSPSLLNGAAAAISGITAVRSLLAPSSEPPRVDDFGEDATLVSRTGPALDFLYRHYWRVSVEGASHLKDGPLLAICNHAGTLPVDGPVVRSALERALPGVKARWLVEDGLFHAPFLGTILNRLGAVRACPENAERLLEEGCAVAVFPEGLWGLQKTFRRRYQLQRFGRGGFVKLALKTGAQLVPTAIVGVEESMPVLATLPGGPFGLPFVPVTPTFPLLGLAGLVPLPTKWTIAFGKPLDLSSYGPEDAKDLALVHRLTEEVRERIHAEIKRVRAERPGVFRS